MWTVRRLVSLLARGGGEPGVRDPVFALVGEGLGHGELDAAVRDPHERDVTGDALCRFRCETDLSLFRQRSLTSPAFALSALS
jgi:hypothetical protein